MSKKLKIEPKLKRLIYYIEDLENGYIQIPSFQRDFIWDKKDKLDLFDSLKRGYPIGTILFWKPEKRDFGNMEKIGPYYSPEQKEGFFYILDGFQRLSTILGCLINPNKTKLKYDENDLKNNFLIYYDLEKEEFFIPRNISATENFQVPLYILLDTFEFFKFSEKLAKYSNFRLLVDRATTLATKIVDFILPSIEIVGGELEEAVEIFSRINSKGSTISSDWMLSALTYNQDKEFRLGTIIDDLIEDLSKFNFQDIKRDLILQCIINSFGKAYFDQSGKIEELAKRSDFIEKTKEVVESIKRAVEFLYEYLLVVEYKLLPYRNQLIFITDFFNSVQNPTDKQIEVLKKWFWITTYSNYFTIYSLSKQREAYNVFQKFIKGEIDNPLYNDKPEIPFSVTDFPNKIFFGSVRAKALILFLLKYSNSKTDLKRYDIDGLGLGYLFGNRDDKGNFYTESVMPFIAIQNNKSFFKKYDLSKHLKKDSYKTDYELYFLNQEMVELFSQGKKLEILKIRKELIIKAEKEFVESLGMTYEIE
ncbi:MAG: DUF262 domain-containing protein [Candidatus Sericytochromatia bacterium]